MPKTLDITRILREQKEQLRACFQDRLVMTASITLRVIARRGLRSGSASAESAAWFIGEADITLRVDYLIVLFLCFFSPLEFSIEIILGKYFTVSKTACFEPLSEVAVLHHRAAD